MKVGLRLGATLVFTLKVRFTEEILTRLTSLMKISRQQEVRKYHSTKKIATKGMGDKPNPWETCSL